MSRSEIDEIFAAKTKPSPSEQQNVPAKSRHPEIILDSSKKQAQRKRRREKKQTKTDDDRFKDSRGSAPRRKTADGYTIYKEDELGISTTGGDTPLCPFDCQCYFPNLAVFRLYRSLAGLALVAVVCEVNV